MSPVALPTMEYAVAAHRAGGFSAKGTAHALGIDILTGAAYLKRTRRRLAAAGHHGSSAIALSRLFAAGAVIHQPSLQARLKRHPHLVEETPR